MVKPATGRKGGAGWDFPPGDGLGFLVPVHAHDRSSGAFLSSHRDPCPAADLTTGVVERSSCALFCYSSSCHYALRNETLCDNIFAPGRIAWLTLFRQILWIMSRPSQHARLWDLALMMTREATDWHTRPAPLNHAAAFARPISLSMTFAPAITAP